MYALHKLADFVVYQSYYSKRLCDRFLGKAKVPWSIIHNGVEIDKFTPAGKGYDYGDGYILFSLGAFRRKIALYPVLKAYTYLKDKLDRVKLVIAGPIHKRLYYLLPKSKDIIYLGKIAYDKVPFYERGASVFLFPIRSACPNVLIESIACGLPVACYDIGSNREILGNNAAGVLCDSGIEKKFYLYLMLMPNPRNLAEAALEVINNLDNYKKSARRRAERLFRLEIMVSKYVKVFKRVLEDS